MAFNHIFSHRPPNCIHILILLEFEALLILDSLMVYYLNLECTRIVFYPQLK